MTIDLTSEERRLILVTLMNPVIKGLISEPATPRHVRDIYKGLLLKIKTDESLHAAMAKTVRESKIIIPGEQHGKKEG